MRSLVALAVLALLPSGGFATSEVECADDPLCPDLVVDPLDRGGLVVSEETFGSGSCDVLEGLVEPGARTLLRFPLLSWNVGPGDLRVGSPATLPALFEWGGCHGHYHFANFAAYRLWEPTAYARWAAARVAEPDRPASELFTADPSLDAGLVSGRKAGFCLMDVQPLVPSALSARYHCGWQGIRSGWGDRYHEYLPGQWVDVTGVPAGEYVLEAELNPERRIAEASYRDNSASVLVYVPGPGQAP